MSTGYQKKRILLALGVFLVSICGSQIIAQEEREFDFTGFSFDYGINIPAGDISDRFGSFFHAGIALDLFKKKFNGLIRLEGNIFFGDQVDEDVLASQRGSNGQILGFDGRYADVFLRMRGAYAGLMVNKMIISSKDNKYSGFSAGLGLGWMQHKIRLQVDSNNAPQFSGDYQKGYDRNSVGPALKQNFSYLHIGKNKSVNYQISLYLIEAFTSNTRFNFDTGMKDDSGQLDLVIGLDLRWILPIWDKQEPGEIYY